MVYYRVSIKFYADSVVIMNNTTDDKMDPKTDHGRDYKMESAALYFVVSPAR